MNPHPLTLTLTLTLTVTLTLTLGLLHTWALVPLGLLYALRLSLYAIHFMRPTLRFRL